MLDKVFDPGSFEKSFSFEIEASLRKPGTEHFMVLLPPPNVTGSLHMGHALCYTIQDIIARYKRLKGYDVLFQPGLDHAGIVTQLLVEKKLYENGVEKGGLTREMLLKEIWFFKENSGNTILDQMKVLGISCDFARLRFTMDDEAKRAVTKLFVKLFEDNLIYRGKRMVNWDPCIGSAISDLEIVEKEVDGNLWYIKYMSADSSGEYITVATTRPETLFGDTAVAVNPDDKRYKHLVGKEVNVPLIDRKVRIIADRYADPEKGTGAVKITPAHDFNDYEVGIRHRLPVIEIMNFKGELNENVPEIFQLTDRFAAREKVVDLLQKKGLLEKTEKIKQKIPFGDRSDVPLEPMITYQWFVHAEKLAGPAIEAVESGKIKFIPKHWENLYFEWLKNIRPWCISRQIWWGHRIPAWYGPDGQVFVAETNEEATEKAIRFYGKNKVELTQDDDVLDTWFSSGMWPFVTLGWPKRTDEFDRFYSKMIVVTGFDIIFFWIARMIMMSLYSTKKIPFSDVYIHGLVRDEKGRKMSKSRGNVMNPLDLCKKYGADAVRYTLASLSSPGRDVKLNEQLVETGRNFLTKLWNVVRFSQMNGCVHNKEFNIGSVSDPASLWIIHCVKEMVEKVENSMNNYRIDEAVHHIYHCVWDSFCDWYIEFIKPILQQSSVRDDDRYNYDLALTVLKKDIRDTTAWAILQFLKVLYPICPFIAKKLSGEMGVIDATWSEATAVAVDFGNSVKEIEILKELISSVRSAKQCLHIPLGEKIRIRTESFSNHVDNIIAKYKEVIHRMAGVTPGEIFSQSVPIVIDGAIIHMEVGDKIDVEDELKRLFEDLSKMKNSRESFLRRLSNSDFMSKATEEVIEEHKQRVKILDEKIQRTGFIIKSLKVV